MILYLPKAKKCPRNPHGRGDPSVKHTSNIDHWLQHYIYFFFFSPRAGKDQPCHCGRVPELGLPPLLWVRLLQETPERLPTFFSKNSIIRPHALHSYNSYCGAESRRLEQPQPLPRIKAPWVQDQQNYMPPLLHSLCERQLRGTQRDLQAVPLIYSRQTCECQLLELDGDWCNCCVSSLLLSFNFYVISLVFYPLSTGYLLFLLLTLFRRLSFRYLTLLLLCFYRWWGSSMGAIGAGFNNLSCLRGKSGSWRLEALYVEVALLLLDLIGWPKGPGRSWICTEEDVVKDLMAVLDPT